jgi:thermitase
MRRIWHFLAVAFSLALGLIAAQSRAADSLTWRAKQDQVDASIDKDTLLPLLKKIGTATGWKIYYEPVTNFTVSVKFKDVPQDEALRRLLGKLNFSKDQTNGVTRLRVFRTLAVAATESVPVEKKDYRIHNEDLVKLKRGANTNAIDQLAKKLGATVTGRNDGIGIYRLQFPDGTSADAALQVLASDPSVAAADGNYSVDRPTPAQMTPVSAPPGAPFSLNPTPDTSGPILGLVDTSVDPPSQFQKYMLNPINVTGQTDAPNPADPSHGTMMLETMLNAMGGNPSQILPVDVYGSGESTSTYEVIEGVVAAINAGANPVSMSLGGTGDSQMLGSLIQEGQQKGIVFVAAAGNTPGEGDVYPADYPGVVSVTASTQTVSGPITSSSGNVGGGQPQLASYANDPPATAVIAPGTSIVEAVNGQAWEVQGTSPATAATSATIAYLVNQNHMSLSQAVNQVMTVAPAPGR